MVETVSETLSKKGGRPRLLDSRFEAVLRRLWPDLRSGRSLQNRAYFSHAASALKEVPDYLERFRWILGENGEDGSTWRKGVLVELGRVADPETLVKLADNLCTVASRRRLTTTEAVAMVCAYRGYRTGKRWCQPEQGSLADVICTALDQYGRAHPGTKIEDMLEALNEVYGIVSEMTEAR